MLEKKNSYFEKLVLFYFFTIGWGGGGGGGPDCDIITCVNTPFSSRTCWTICPGGKCKGNGKAGPFSEIILTVAGPEIIKSNMYIFQFSFNYLMHESNVTNIL